MTTHETMPNAPEIVRAARPQTTFAGDVMRLISGTAFSQLLGILAAPIITRFYSPEAFGTLAIFTSITSILGIAACLRYELAIVLPESDEEAANLWGVSMVFSVLTSMLTIPIIWWGREPLLRWLHAPELAPYLWLVPLLILFGGIGVGHPALNYWASRTRRFKELSITRVIGTVTTTGAQIGGGFFGFGSVGGLIEASVLGAIITPLVLTWSIWRNDGELFLRSINMREMLTGIKRYRRFPLFTTWAAVLNTVSWQLPAFLLSAFFSTTVVGFYALGFRIIQLPMGLIGASLGQVFYQRAAVANVNGELDTLVESTFRQLVMFSLIPMVLLSVIGSDLFTVLFGAKWTEAGVYAQILAPWGFVWFISSPLSTLNMVLEKQQFGLFVNVLIFLTRLGSLIIGGFLGNVYTALILFSVSGVIVYGYLNLWLMGLVGLSWHRVLRILAPYLAFSFVVVICLGLVKASGANVWLTLAVACAIGVAFFAYVAMRVPQFQMFWKLK